MFGRRRSHFEFSEGTDQVNLKKQQVTEPADFVSPKARYKSTTGNLSPVISEMTREFPCLVDRARLRRK